MGQYASYLSNWTVRAIARANLNGFFLLQQKNSEFIVF